MSLLYSKKPAGVTREWKQIGITDNFGTGRTLTITETPGGGYAPVKSLNLTIYDNQSFAALGLSVINQRAFPMPVARIGVIDKAAFFPGRKASITRDGDLVKLTLTSETTTDAAWSIP